MSEIQEKTQAQTQAQEPSTKARSGRSVFSVLGALLVALVIIAFLPLTAVRLVGLEPYAVISGSMEPAIPTGSLVLVQQESASHIEVGQIAAFYSGGVVVTHRVVGIDAADKTITTKGDANEKQDLRPTSFSSVIGVVMAHVPILGYVFQIITDFWGKVFAVGCIVLAIACFALARRR